MADEQQSPTVEVAPTIIISNSSDEPENVETTDSSENSGDGASEFSPSIDGNATIDIAPPAIAIAEIEASRDIAVEEIRASVERERIAAQSDDGELEEWQKEIRELKAEITTLREAVSLLTPPAVLEAPEEALEIVQEPNLTQPSTAVPTIETMTEPSAESVEENPVVEMDVRGRRFIAI